MFDKFSNIFHSINCQTISTWIWKNEYDFQLIFSEFSETKKLPRSTYLIKPLLWIASRTTFAPSFPIELPKISNLNILLRFFLSHSANFFTCDLKDNFEYCLIMEKSGVLCHKVLRLTIMSKMIKSNKFMVLCLINRMYLSNDKKRNKEFFLKPFEALHFDYTITFL